MDIDVLIVGGGVVGLACARALAHSGRQPWVLESEARCGDGVSSRNSGVIHAGMYYPTGSLKARLCVRGLRLLYDYCSARGIAHRRTGKLIVAVSESERAALAALYARGQANAAPELRWLEGAAACALEPALLCVAAIESPHTGIVDVPELVTALIGDAESRGGRVLTEMEVAVITPIAGGFLIRLRDGSEVSARNIVNAAGLQATQVAQGITGFPAQHVPRLYFGAGHYYTMHGRCPFSRLIYPLPEPAGLGVHLGMDLSGRCRFGPDVRWRERIDYQFDDSQRAHFGASIQRWWPALELDNLLPDFVGIRPKLTGPGASNGDFRIDDVRLHGVTGLINLFGIESPGLTSALAIGEEVALRLAASAA